MNGVNKVILVGTLGQDPKVLTSRDGKEYTSLSLATNRSWNNKEGKHEQRTDWHRISVWGRQGTHCQQYLRKGNPVCVEGHITTTETTEEDGSKKWSTYITADAVNFLPGRGESSH